MTEEAAGLAVTADAELLERSIGYALGCLRLVTPDLLACPTPCVRWDLRALLWHLHDSLRALHEAADAGNVRLRPATAEHGDPVAAVRDAARALLGAWAGAEEVTVSVAGHDIGAGLVTGAGAIEMAVHGWDVAVASGHHRPIPPPLSTRLLSLSPLVVDDTDRPERFAARIPAPRTASPGDRLVSFLGRAVR